MDNVINIIFMHGVRSYDNVMKHIILKTFDLIHNVMSDCNVNTIDLSVFPTITATIFENTLHNILTLQNTDEQITDYLLANNDVIYEDVQCLSYAIDNGVMINDVMLEQILICNSEQSLDCIKLIVNHGYILPNDSYEFALKYCNTNFFTYAYEQGCKWNNNIICCRAAAYDNLECLKYAHEHGGVLTYSVYFNLILNKNYNCYEYARNNQCQIDALLYRLVMCRGDLDDLKRVHEVCDGHDGCLWDAYFCSGIVKTGNLDMLQYAHENGCPWNSWTCFNAAKFGQLDCLKYAHERRCHYDKNILLQETNECCREYIEKFM